MRALWLLPAGAALAVGLGTGLTRLGWPLPPLPAGAHGPLMVGGFLGTLVGLERAVALSNLGRAGRASWIGPACTGASALLLLAGDAGPAPRLLLVSGSLALVVVNLFLLRLRPDAGAATMLAGSLAWVGGNLLWWRGLAIPAAVPWWVAFLVLTVAGERLELSRLRRLPAWASRALPAALAVVAAGLVLSRLQPDLGWRIAGAGFLAAGLWFLQFDLARRTLRQPGVTGYSALGVLFGHGWLALGGLLMVVAGASATGYTYDAVLHAFFLGFAFSMIFAHAPLIAPAVLGVRVPFRACAYGPLLLLQASLLVRVAADLAAWPPGRAWGGLVNALAIGAFLLHMVTSVRRGSREGPPLAPNAGEAGSPAPFRCPLHTASPSS